MANYLLFTSFYDQTYRMMLMKQYSGRQRAYQEAVKYFIGGSKKYGSLGAAQSAKHRNKSSAKNGKKKGKKKKKWKSQVPKDPEKNQRVIIAFGDAKMAFNMPGTLSVSHRKLKHYMAIASKRLGRFTAEEVGQDSPLIGQLKFQVVDIPEYMTSQASSI